MHENTTHTAPPNEPAGPTGPSSAESSKGRSTPTKRLPTNRISFPNQLNILRAYAAASQNGVKAVENKDVASITNMSPDTVSLANPFFSDIGLLIRTENGYVPTPEVLNFARVYQWDPEKASAELAPKISDTWFAETLLSRLSFSPMENTAAITELAKVANADTAYRQQLAVLLDYLEAAALVESEGGMLKSVTPRERSQDKTTTSTTTITSDLSANTTGLTPPSSRTVTLAAPSGLPLLIQGLLQQLPADDQWTREGMSAWLELAENVFKVVYKIPSPDSEDQP